MAIERIFQRLQRKVEKTQYQAIQLVSVKRSYLEKRDKNRFRELVEIPSDFQLSEEQVIAATSHAKQTLVVAGAGSGKTFVLVGRAKYLIESSRATEEGVLLLAFNKDAAEELHSRSLASGVSVTAKTFHSFGNSIVKSDGAQTGVAFGDKGSVERFFANILKSELSKSDRDNLATYFATSLVPFRENSEFKSLSDYASYVRAAIPVTLNDERVKSHGEWLIANFLWSNNIDYEYEALYQSRDKKDTHKPDFMVKIPNGKTLWIEYFGSDRNGSVSPDINPARYQDSINWKREIHNKNQTDLVEVFYYDLKEGVLLEKLRAALLENGATFSPKPAEEILAQANAVGYQIRFLKISEQFLGHARSQRLSMADLELKAYKSERNSVFLGVFKIFLDAYLLELERLQLPDFAELIHGAADRIQSGEYAFNFSHLLVDEFQDISKDRFRLIEAMMEANPNLEVTYVGDDWQSIYRFGGSDVSIMREVSKPRMTRKRIDLTASYRLPQNIADISRDFILKNPLQLEKNVVSKSTLGINGNVYIHWDTEVGSIEENLKKVISRIGDAKNDPGSSIRVLARYVNNLPNKKLVEKYWEGPIEVSSIHSAKGLEADYVIVMDLVQDNRGFPSTIEDDPVMGMVMPENDIYEHGEERRLFYVALTRAMRETHLISPVAAPSIFTREMLKDSAGTHVGLESKKNLDCPACDSGTIVASSRSGVSICNNYPFCDFFAPKCATCDTYLIYAGGLVRYECNNKCTNKIPLCPSCNWGILTQVNYIDKRTGSEKNFMSCHTWRSTKCKGSSRY